MPHPMSSGSDFDQLIERAYSATTWQERDAAQGELKRAGRVALPAMERTLADPRWQARRLVAQLLDNALDDTNVHVLLRALRDPNAIVRRNSLHSLICEDCKPEGCWTVDMTGVLIGILRGDRSPRVRVAAIGYIDRRPPEPRIAEALREVMATHAHPRVRERAERVLAHVEKRLAASA